MRLKLLATDLDGTLFHSRRNKHNTLCLQILSSSLKDNKIKLVFVTGRHLQLVKEAINKFSLPQPDAIIGDVGTKIYYKKGDWKENKEWKKYILKNNPSYDSKKISLILKLIPEIVEQEKEKQSLFKHSYYIEPDKHIEAIIEKIQNILKENGINAKIIYSVGFKEKKGSIDIIPENASKHAAIGFLRRKWKIEKECVVVAGDSGNDLDMLCAGYKTILVGNALLNIRNYLLEEVRKNKIKEVYFSKKSAACGVVEGINHFLKEGA